MLIIPIHDNFDWKKPPVITLCLVFACCVIYFGFQAKDEEYIQKSYQYYLQSKLPTIEFPRYIDFLHELGEHRKAKTITKLSKHKRFRIAILQTTLRDHHFQTALTSHKIVQRDEPVFQQWQHTRQHFLTLQNKSLTLRYGLTPAKPGIINYLSYNFLHGSFAHLLGNMIFLLILGFALEKTLSRTVFFSTYLATGVLSGAFYVFIDPLSVTPTIGASGAISGLMGLYTLIYGLRQVNFFFYAIVYFDYIKAPAIILFPIWLGHELYQMYSNPNSNINYYAHIGGLLSGALAGIIIKLSKLKIDFSDNHAAHDKECLDKKLNEALKAFGALNYEKARQLLKILHKDYPHNTLVLEHYYSVLNHGSPRDTYHRVTNKLLALPVKSPQEARKTVQLFHAYLKKTGNNSQFRPSTLIHLTRIFCRYGMLDEAEAIVRFFEKQKPEASDLPGLLWLLASTFFKQKNYDKQTHYTQRLISQFGNSIEAQNARDFCKHKPS